jgi:hypothetical protein
MAWLKDIITRLSTLITALFQLQSWNIVPRNGSRTRFSLMKKMHSREYTQDKSSQQDLLTILRIHILSLLLTPACQLASHKLALLLIPVCQSTLHNLALLLITAHQISQPSSGTPKNQRSHLRQSFNGCGSTSVTREGSSNSSC